jgi:hypothetical protein
VGPAAGEASLRDHLATFAVLEDALPVAERLDALAEAWQTPRPSTALVSLSAAAAIRDDEGVAPTARQGPRLHAPEARLVAQLGADAVQAQATGRAMDPLAAARYVEAIAMSVSRQGSPRRGGRG